MQILIVIVFILLQRIDSLQILFQSIQQTCFALTTQKNHEMSLHIYSHDKNDYEHFQYFIIDPNAKPILKRSDLKTDQPIIKDQLKAKMDGRYQLCIRQIDHIERFIDIAFISSAPISEDDVQVDNRLLDHANFQGILIDFEKDYQKSQELIEDLDITKTNHLELVKFMDNQVEVIKGYQYIKVYLVTVMTIVQIIVFTSILKNKEQISIV